MKTYWIKKPIKELKASRVFLSGSKFACENRKAISYPGHKKQSDFITIPNIPVRGPIKQRKKKTS